MTMKDAAVYSVGIILFSQLAKLITTAITDSIPQFNYYILIFAVIAAVLGGILGAMMNKKSNEKTIKIVFTIVVSCVAVVSLCNAII